MTERAVATIDLGALTHNLSVVRQYAPHSSILAMVKSNAYGHGMIPVAKALGDVDGLGVCCMDEAVQLHDAGIRKRIIIMDGFNTIDELSEIIDKQFEMVLHTVEQLVALESYRGEGQLSVWLRIDTGMNCLGFHVDSVPEVIQRLSKLNWINKPLRVLTHFANADDPSNPYTQQQINHLNTLELPNNTEKSLANSAGIVAWQQSHADWVRPGIMLYGASPILHKVGADFNLKPVMQLRAKIIALKELHKGDAVGYGSRYVCSKSKEKMAVISIGYGDGYPWQAKDGTPVSVNGVKCPIIGRISMDMITVDVSKIENVAIGDWVELWGSHLSIEYVANNAGTIAYDLLCSVFCSASKRVKLEWISRQVQG